MRSGPITAHRPPTARQLALAADIAKRFAATGDLSPEEETHVASAADLMGMRAWRLEAERG